MTTAEVREEVRRQLSTGELDMTDAETRRLVMRVLGIESESKEVRDLKATLDRLDAADAGKRPAAPAKRSTLPALDSTLPPPPARLRPRNRPHARLVSWNGKSAVWDVSGASF